MKEPFAYVLYIEHDFDEHVVSVWQTLDDAEDALRDYTKTIAFGVDDEDILKTLAQRVCAHLLVRAEA
jgi:hypothetical protein